ncbi:hypothetical protein [Rubrivivax gelatinosus]|uniref:hypothetical protein n=1 Tax=Rubrivivax gelatinosus TaxID=28068 RepID=UPI0019078FA8|nr:hypothetical protein [Rubrivivax gelatinosus]
MRTVYATVLEVRENDDIVDTLDIVGRWITDWYARHGISVTNAIAALADGSIDVVPMPGHRLNIETLVSSARPGESLVELSWGYPDQYDSSLGWRTHLAMLRGPESLTIALDIAVTGLTFRVAPANIKLGSPRVVRDICLLPSAFLGGRPYKILPEPLHADKVEELLDELIAPDRAYPVLVVSRRNGSNDALVDPQRLASSIAGVGKLYELADKWAAFKLAEEVGRELSCFDGAMRLYWPGFTVESDPYAHPLWLAKVLADEPSAVRATGQVARSIFEAASFRFAEPTNVSSLRHTAEREARAAYWGAAADSEDIDKLLNDLYALQDKLAATEKINEELTEECETLRSNAMALASPSAWQQELPSASTSASTSALTVGAPLKCVLDALHAARETAPHLHFTNTAFESAKESPYRQPDRVVQALDAINEVAAIWVKSLEIGTSVGSLRQHFKDRGFNYSDDVSRTSVGKWADEYSTTYEGNEYDIAPHITIGAKQADTCLSIHWAWDKDRKKALVAHVGRHKTNTKT